MALQVGRILRPLVRSYSSKVGKSIVVNCRTFETDDSHTNVTPTILSLTERSLHLQKAHPIGILRDMIEQRLNSVDNAYETYNEFRPAVSVAENFDSLGFPADHPGRSRSDTYYINKEHLLRTHTSAHEMECFGNIRNGATEKPGFLISADVYRRDEIDRTHYPGFHQMEGARMWKRDLSAAPGQEPAHLAQLRADIAKVEEQLRHEQTRLQVEDSTTLEGNPKQDYMTEAEVDLCAQHLKRSVELVVAQVFNKKLQSVGNPGEVLQVRWIKAYFPWTAPSWEIEVWWKGEWLELCGCGLVREQVYLNAGFAPNTHVGWAFGLGLDRIAMLLFDIPDIRLFWTLDERFHSQFRPGEITTFKPYSKYPASTRDVAFWLPEDKQSVEFHENDIMELVRNTAGDLVESVKLLDKFVHPKTGRTSLCYRINYQSMDRTVTNAEVNVLQEQVSRELVRLYNVQLR
ncbi:ADL305Cp [Eremothecium gossypii ATCC 10895]|uniref:Phenylalanine--tRNA ligase, mitochondrial n=1 Tax=Eremothecium gossypii (strain ATCC 10895 / CBS 109.51 / FGSC 9923 / NRRL Y-1056) TaxID=284811 RepID=Q75B77_EREGS|nr:ADL305Cp [Eremothecium gossypii ATCC 10895]AAS51615.2 ADL305Cp [Eremothecium gossypii ATCC 10895]